MNMSAARRAACLAAAALLVPAVLAAQGHQAHHPPADGSRATGGTTGGGMMGGAMMHGSSGMMSGQMGMGMMRPGPRMLLRQKDALELSDDQVARLEELQARLDDLRSERRSAMAPLMEEIRALRSSEDPDLERYESLLRERADAHVGMQIRTAEIHRDALDVLNEQQKSNVRYGMRMMRSMRSGDAGMPGGMMGFRPDGKGMMGGTGQEMMKMMARMHGQMQPGDCPLEPSPDGG